MNLNSIDDVIGKNFEVVVLDDTTDGITQITDILDQYQDLDAVHIISHGDENSSRVVGRSIEQIKLPHGTTIGAIVRNNEVVIAHHDTVIKANDHVILFLVDKRRIPDVEKLFQVSYTFF